MLYPKNSSDHLEDALFQNPTSEYRGAPFWAWNDHLDEQTIRDQVHMFKEMGMGGFHSHVRTGLDTPYLGDEFMHMMRAANDEAKKTGLLHWLYDEDRWPSGACGGMVTENPDYCQRLLLFTGFKEPDAIGYPEDGHLHHGQYYELARYKVTLREGLLEDYACIGPDEEADWYAYLYLQPKSSWYNNQSYVNTLDPKSMRQFLKLTHETYAKDFAEEFSKSIPAIFTDEPQFARKETLVSCEEKQRVSIPWTDDLEQTYQAAYGDSLLNSLPEIFWERADGQVSVTRYRYHDHLCERFTEAFADQVGGWCVDHNLMLTGHMMEEQTLDSQTGMLGEAMRSYRGFGLPGIDMLCDRREYSTAKQAQSASRQLGRPGVTSELYGVTNWDFDFRGHKLQGDWQAALGITTRVHHLTWMSMRGEAKRDYPASIGFQSPWYKDYNLIEDHFARINTAMTRGKAHVRIGMIHPIESYWLYFGSNEKTGAIRAEIDEHFAEIIRWLLGDTLDFDYISESLMLSMEHGSRRTEDGTPLFQVGQMAYEVVLVPDLKTIRRTTLDALKGFVQQGGTVIWVGEIPSYVDALPSDEPVELAAKCSCVPFVKTKVQQALEPWRDVEIISRTGHHSVMGDCDPGTHTVHLLYQLRDDGEDKWLFIAQGDKMPDPDQPHEEKIEICIRGQYDVRLYDTMTGEIRLVPYETKAGWTKLLVSFYEHDSLLLKLTPAVSEEGMLSLIWLHPEPSGEPLEIPDRVPVTLEEDNVLLLDMPAYSLDGEEYHPQEEILRIDTILRVWLGWPLRTNRVAQPWVMSDDSEESHTVSLRYMVETKCEIKGAKLALENKAGTQVKLDGTVIDSSEDQGYYVDPAIRYVLLPDLEAGVHTIELTMKFTPKTNLECVYLTGDFSVWVNGRQAVIDQPVRELSFSDLTRQGLPFYGGNLIYHIPVEVQQDEVIQVQVSQYRAPLWEINGAKNGTFSPYTAIVPVKAGAQTLDLKVYGNRINTFGQVHNCDETMTWFGAMSWRTGGTAWSYEYHLKRTGMLKSPAMFVLDSVQE